MDFRNFSGNRSFKLQPLTRWQTKVGCFACLCPSFSCAYPQSHGPWPGGGWLGSWLHAKIGFLSQTVAYLNINRTWCEVTSFA